MGARRRAPPPRAPAAVLLRRCAPAALPRAQPSRGPTAPPRPPLWPVRATAPVVAGAQAATAKVTEDGRGKGEVEEDDRWGQGQIRLFTSSPSQK